MPDGLFSYPRQDIGVDFHVADYREHATGHGEDASATAYVEIRTAGGDTLFGVGQHKNIVTASLRAVMSAVNRGCRKDMIERPGAA